MKIQVVIVHTSPPLFYLLGPFGCSSGPLFLLLLGSASVEVFDNNTNKHVEDKEANQEKEGDEVDQTPFIKVFPWL
jgi:hypothetical protein